MAGDRRRRVAGFAAAVALAGLLLPIFAIGGFAVGAWAGCRADTVGGSAGAENDPCRDAAPAMLTGIAGGVAAWFVVGSVVLAVAARREERYAALVSPSASPNTSG